MASVNARTRTPGASSRMISVGPSAGVMTSIDFADEAARRDHLIANLQRLYGFSLLLLILQHRLEQG